MLRSRDGTPIAAFRFGSGPLTWVVPPAIGAPLLSMQALFEPLASRCTILTWDMRGFYSSGAPQDAAAYSVDRHLDDLEVVIEEFGAGDFVLGGWSMGVQLSLEYAHRHAERVRALVLISGPYRRALEGLLPGVHRVVVPGLRYADRLGPAVTRCMRFALAPAWLPRGLAHVGVIAGEPEFFGRVVERFREVDWGRYLMVARHLHEHDAGPHLARILAPTLIVAGTRDFLTPLAIAKRMHKMIANSELFVVPRASHYIVIEFGEVLARRIALFLDERKVATGSTSHGK